MQAIHEVYGWVKATRKGLLDYCATLPPEVFTAEREDMGWGSIRNALVHNASTYLFWLAGTVLGRDVPGFKFSEFHDVETVARLFSGRVDPLVEEFAAAFGGGDRLAAPLSLKVRWQEGPLVVSPLWVFTHVVTHEFHHKGQIVAFGRIHGYPPPETDLAV